MTCNQAIYHARRAYRKEYALQMHNPQGPGRAYMREDSAQFSACSAFQAKLRKHGFDPETEEAGIALEGAWKDFANR